MRRLLPWVSMAVIIATSLAFAMSGDREGATEADRVRHIASEVRCPTCQGLSAAESDAKAAEAIRDEIRDRLRDGESASAIRAYLVSRYGDDILLRPPGTGIGGLVWALPVGALVIALAALIAAFARWRRRSTGVHASEGDRRLVDEALESA